MKHCPITFCTLLAGLSGLALSVSGYPQESQSRPTQPFRTVEPPGHDLFIPLVPDPTATTADQMRNLQQIRILAEMNKLTVELVKRRSNRYVTGADTPQLVKRLKRLAKELHELN